MLNALSAVWPGFVQQHIVTIFSSVDLHHFACVKAARLNEACLSIVYLEGWEASAVYN